MGSLLPCGLGLHLTRLLNIDSLIAIVNNGDNKGPWSWHFDQYLSMGWGVCNVVNSNKSQDEDLKCIFTLLRGRLLN